MAKKRDVRSSVTQCAQCPLRKLKAFREFGDEELAYISEFKTGELKVDAGATVLVEGSHSAHLYTVLAGWAFRYKLLEDGRRQILNYVSSGDLVGLQGSLHGEMQHSIETLTPVTLCVFERDRLDELFSNHPSLSFDLTWIASREERILDENLLSIGRRTAEERAAYLLSFLARKSAIRPANMKNGVLPITQSHVADTLGLSVVHTNKTLRKLAARGLVKWRDRGCEILDESGLARVAAWPHEPVVGRPFL